MGASTQRFRRDRLAMAVSAVLLAGGLLGLQFPVSLGDYDMYGIQIKCSNGYSSQLLQAEADDQEAARRSAHDGASAVGYVDRCNSALAYRRAWATASAGLGALTLVFTGLVWMRRRATAPDSPEDSWSETPDDYLHEAAYLDRRALPRRERPHGTTL